MIKLNNKNITYVALADSNNSLKAPKEIWYADTNNSVKLVYRRKDALIEGEDYEKYHWLVSNSEDSQTPYIDTLIPPNLNQNIVSSFKVINSANNGGEPGIWGAILGTSWNNCVIRCFKPKSYGYTILEFNNNNVDFPMKENMLIKTEFSEGKEYDCSLSINSSTTALGVINNESKELVANSNVNFVLNPQPTYKLFVEQNAPTWSFNSLGFKKFSITNIISLVPCKLLKPVPKWLDANGIRRQVGECGMIDLVSGKFYGNVNSVGTFTVENYYERKEWLVGDGSAYINTKVKLHFATDSVYIKGRNNGVPTNEARYFGNYSGGQNAKSLELIYNKYVQNDTVNKQSAYDGRFRINPSSEFEFFTTPFSSTTSVTTIYDNIDTIFNVNLDDSYLNYEASNDLILLNTNDTRYCMKADVANFKVMRSSTIIRNLIPCTLTMDLPASMDANNIARTKGTSGMWDLVSDRFYGNVANSGTFKAVNLAEGVDYEVHQWLGSASGNPYIVVQKGVNTDVNAYVETTYKCNYSNAGTDIIIGVSINESNNIGIRIFNSAYNGGTTYVDYHKTVNGVLSSFRTTKKQDNINAERYIKATLDKLIIDNSEYQISFGNGFDNLKDYSTRLLFNANNNAVRYKRTKIRVNNIEYDLIPVKLLKSIPSKYDANGIARQAGECGMYDTVNDKFYGNVASSGTFTVSD